MTTIRSLPYPAGRCLGTLAERSLVGTPTSYLLRSTCSSAEAGAEVLRAAAFWGLGRGFARAGLAGRRDRARAATSSSLRMPCQPAMPRSRAITASSFLEYDCSLSLVMRRDSVGTCAARARDYGGTSVWLVRAPGRPFRGGTELSKRGRPRRGKDQGRSVRRVVCGSGGVAGAAAGQQKKATV